MEKQYNQAKEVYLKALLATSLITKGCEQKWIRYTDIPYQSEYFNHPSIPLLV